MPRMIDMGIEPFLLTASVNVVMAQRLVRRVCPHCKKESEFPKGLMEEIKKDLPSVPKEYLEGLDIENLKVYKGAGCEKCGHTGYVSRFGIYEVLMVTPEIQDMILSKASTHKIYEVAAKMGMISMKQDGILKALRGETTIDEIIRVTTE